VLRYEGLANGTINRKLAALSKMLAVAVERQGLSHKPKLPRMREGIGRIRYLTADEERVLLGLLGQWSMPDHVDAVTVLVDTGLRVGELFRLTARDVDQKVSAVPAAPAHGRPDRRQQLRGLIR
jgi:integrase